MLLVAPKGVTSVSLAGTEYKVQKGEVEVPDKIGLALLDHGLTIKIVGEELPQDDPPKEPDNKDKDQADPPKTPDDKKKSGSSTPPEEKAKDDAASGDGKNGK